MEALGFSVAVLNRTRCFFHGHLDLEAEIFSSVTPKHVWPPSHNLLIPFPSPNSIPKPRYGHFAIIRWRTGLLETTITSVANGWRISLKPWVFLPKVCRVAEKFVAGSNQNKVYCWGNKKCWRSFSSPLNSADDSDVCFEERWILTVVWKKQRFRKMFWKGFLVVIVFLR